MLLINLIICTFFGYWSIFSSKETIKTGFKFNQSVNFILETCRATKIKMGTKKQIKLLKDSTRSATFIYLQA